MARYIYRVSVKNIEGRKPLVSFHPSREEAEVRAATYPDSPSVIARSSLNKKGNRTIIHRGAGKKLMSMRRYWKLVNEKYQHVRGMC